MDNISIRQYKEEDIPSFYQAVIESKAEISKWLPWCHENYSLEDATKWINEQVPQIWQSKNGCEFVIAKSGHNKIIGGCCLEQIDFIRREANIGYWIHSGETGKGIATFACHFLIDYGFNELNLERINVIPSSKNTPSKKVAEKLPYDSIEIVKNGFKIRESISDALVYIITRNSYKEKE